MLTVLLKAPIHNSKHTVLGGRHLAMNSSFTTWLCEPVHYSTSLSLSLICKMGVSPLIT